MQEYTGVLVEPWEIEREFGGYSDPVMMNMLSLDDRCIVSESVSRYPEDVFDVVTYEDLDSYVESGKPVFISGTPELIEKAVEEIDHPDVTVDENVLSYAAVQEPSTRRMWLEELSSLIPMYEPDRKHVQVADTEEVLSEIGIEEVEAAPSQFLTNQL